MLEHQSSEIHTRLARPEDGAEIVELFRRSGVPCFCQYYQFDGDHRAWQMLCASDPTQNESNLLTDLSQGRITGIVALRGSRAVGWARIAPQAQLAKLYQNRLYRSLPVLTSGDRRSTMALACFLVEPKERRHGVARALLATGLDLAVDLKASAVEAFPRGAIDVTDEEQWTGPAALFEAAGFDKVHDFAPYPVFRKKLTSFEGAQSWETTRK